MYIPFGPDTKRNGGGGGGGGNVCFGPDAKSGRDWDLIRIPRIAGVGVLPISHSLAALAIYIRKGGVSITYC